MDTSTRASHARSRATFPRVENATGDKREGEETDNKEEPQPRVGAINRETNKSREMNESGWSIAATIAQIRVQ